MLYICCMKKTVLIGIILFFRDVLAKNACCLYVLHCKPLNSVLFCYVNVIAWTSILLGYSMAVF